MKAGRLQRSKPDSQNPGNNLTTEQRRRCCRAAAPEPARPAPSAQVQTRAAAEARGRA